MLNREVQQAEIGLDEGVRLKVMQDELSTLKERTVAQEAELSELRSLVNQLSLSIKEGASPSAERKSPHSEQFGEPSGDTLQKTTRRSSRRGLLKLAASAAAAATVGGLITNPGQAQAASGQSMIIGQPNLQSLPNDVTSLLNSSSSQLQSATLWANNFTLNDVNHPAVSLPANTRIGVAGLTSGIDTTTDARVGVYGEAGNSNDASTIGVWGQSLNGIGVKATSDTGTALYAHSNTYIGISVSSNTNAAIYATSTSGYGAIFAGGHAPILLTAASSAGAPTSPGHFKGEIYVDNAGVFWICQGSGSPGAWQKVAGVNSTATGGAVNFLSSPDRIIDTRSGGGNIGGFVGPFANNTTHNFSMAGATGSGGIIIPANAIGIIGNITVDSRTTPANAYTYSYVTVYPTGVTKPVVSNVNYTPQQVLSNSFAAALGTAGHLTVYVNGATNVIIDVTGYFI